jgi:hypothetical protein
LIIRLTLFAEKQLFAARRELWIKHHPQTIRKDVDHLEADWLLASA